MQLKYCCTVGFVKHINTVSKTYDARNASQETKTEHSSNIYLLVSRHLQSPDTLDRENQYGEIRDYIQDSRSHSCLVSF